MKKLSLLFIVGLLVVACGKKYEVYTKEQKEEMYRIAVEEKEKGNDKKMEEIEKLMTILEIEAKKGDKTAEIEMGEWYWLRLDYTSITEKVKGKKADLLNRKW